MDNLISIAKQRAQRTKAHRYGTPLPFDGLAISKPRAQDTSRKFQHQLDKSDSQNSSTSSRPSQASADTSSTEPSSTSAETRIPDPRSKHVPLHKIIEFRVSHARNPSALATEVKHAAPTSLRGPELGVDEQRIVRDGVPHFMTRQSSVMVEAVEGVPLTSTWHSHANIQNDMTIPETEAEMIRTISLSSEDNDLSLDAEYEAYKKHYARPPPVIWHGNHGNGHSATDSFARNAQLQSRSRPLTKALQSSSRTDTRQISPRPFNRGTEHAFIDPYSYSNRSPPSSHPRQRSSQPRLRSREQGSFDAKSLSRSARPYQCEDTAGAAPAPIVPLQGH